VAVAAAVVVDPSSPRWRRVDNASGIQEPAQRAQQS